jgi:hypothetical protein
VYAVEFDPIAEKQRDTLPSTAGPAFMELHTLLEVAPWSGDPPSNNPAGNMLTHTFGDFGVATYLVMEERRLVYVVRVTWIG